MKLPYSEDIESFSFHFMFLEDIDFLFKIYQTDPEYVRRVYIKEIFNIWSLVSQE